MNQNSPRGNHSNFNRRSQYVIFMQHYTSSEVETVKRNLLNMDETAGRTPHRVRHRGRMSRLQNSFKIVLSHDANYKRSTIIIYGRPCNHLAPAWRNGSALVSISGVTLRRARLVLGWAASVCYKLPRSTRPGRPFVGRRNEYPRKLKR